MSKQLTHDQKKVLRDKTAAPVRPAIPDDANHMRPYATWKHGQARPFVPQFEFNNPAPSKALARGTKK